MGHQCALTFATYRPGTMRSASGRDTKPPRRISSEVMTKIAAGASVRFWLFLDAEVTFTLMDNSCSIVRSERLAFEGESCTFSFWLPGLFAGVPSSWALAETDNPIKKQSAQRRPLRGRKHSTFQNIVRKFSQHQHGTIEKPHNVDSTGDRIFDSDW